MKTRNNNCNQHQVTISKLANCITIMMEPKGNKKAKGFKRQGNTQQIQN